MQRSESLIYYVKKQEQRMDLEIIVLSEVSQKEKDKDHMISLTCGIQNTTQMNLSTKQKQTHRHRG